MPLRTPRRRISPRTKRRYRAIKHFFRKTLGSASQPEIQINSSITDNVTDLKDKIIGLEQQLSEVSKHCRDIIRLESSSQRESQTYVASEPREHGTEREDSIGRPKQVETKVLYKTSESHYRNTDGSDYVSRHDIHPNVSQNLSVKDHQTPRSIKPQKKKSKVYSTVKDMNIYNMNPSYSKKKPQNMQVYSSSSFHSLSDFTERIPNPGIASIDRDKKHNRVEKQHFNQIPSKMYNEHMQKNYETFERYYDKHNRYKKIKQKAAADALDQDFITDIIKRQYKPVKLFDRRASNLSQVSEPVCRDHDFHINENIQENSELCSCCYGRCPTRRAHQSDYSDTRSICDARLYRSKRMPRVKERRVYPDAYNDSELYDLVPVKEYSNHKTKRKSFQECIPYDYYREVPPSPKTHRPRLNLKAQYYTASEDHIDFLKNSKKKPPKLYQKHHEISEVYDSDETEELTQIHRQLHERRPKQRLEKIDKHQKIQDDNLTLSSVRCNPYMNEPKNIVDTPLNKTLESDQTDDKTDRALCEIKDILQSFLQEIKKEASSQSAKSDLSTKMDKAEAVTSNPAQTTQVDSGVMPNSGHSFNNYNVPSCPAPPSPFMPAFPNPCCYPMLPVCPMNCMQNGYVVPSPSYTCGNCTTRLDDTVNKSTSGNAANDNTCTETDELIKEIYKFIAQSPTFSRKQEDVLDSTTKRVEQSPHKLTSRSAGGSTQVCRHDAKVGTPNIRSYSKSCEAIGSRMISEYYSGTNASYSETGLENVSLETTATTKSTSDTEISTEISEKDKATRGKFANMLRSLGLFKKKRDAIEEEDESETSIEPEMMRRSPHPTPPFRQHLTSYAMYEQQPYRPPPPAHTHRPQPEYGPERAPPYNPGVNEYHMPHIPDPIHHPVQSYYPGQSPSAPPFANYDYHHPPYTPHHQPQPPLCLKEIEVKSIGCQSERKLSFFRKITKKAKQPDSYENQAQRNFSTQTTLPAQNRPGLFSWRSSQPSPKYEDPFAYSFKTQKKLAEGDLKMRKAMLKKMFYKRNPFSPNNLIIRTLLGKDKSSWGDAPVMHRPRMFL